MAELIEGLKKSDMAEQAERLLSGTNWLPEPLRTPGIETVTAAETVETEEPDILPAEIPAFLSAAE
jgi:ParB family chromosome partitioning protein